MNLNSEIVILYSEADDRPIEGGVKGWVTNFHKFLRTLLSQINRQEPEILLMNEMDFDLMRVRKAAVVINILSPNFVQSEIIVNALNNFGKDAKKNDELIIDGVARYFKVLKAPFETDEIMPEFQELISYDFYMIDALTGEAQEFTRFFGNEAERGYWMKLVDMAYDISQILTALRHEEKSERKEEVSREKTVYLASTGVDMLIQRDIIKRELQRHGYTVLPKHALPKELKSLEQMVLEDLAKCRLSIHLIGEDYGYRPKGSDLSVVDLQNRIASEHTEQIAAFNRTAKVPEPFSRLIWVSPDLKNITERQKIFIEDLKSDAAKLEEAEVLQITLQELKAIIREELVTGGRFNLHREVEGYTPEPEDDTSPIIYLIHDKRDKNDTKIIEDFLIDKGYRVVGPSYEGDLIDIRYIHQENLRRCDASLIFYGNTTEDWIKTKLQDLLKAPGFG
ncbi:MAG: DUF4062 domain-containing protein, partial [Cyclobacteriaceae bacterium]|nr:DUF4062 domain-containing protein [Cyclobacteriaceae bacterium SS2]MBV6647830.1 DUF4062 domain-containing protein [Cyclobacteriaceae bacterium HetDA_MAG_MS6]